MFPNLFKKFKKALQQIQNEKQMGIQPNVNKEILKPKLKPVDDFKEKNTGFIIPNYDKQGDRIEKLGI